MTKITTENYDSEQEAWLALLSSYIISRTKHFLSSETRKVGRILTLLSGVVILISLRLVDLERADVSVASLTIKSHANIIIALVAFYYLVTFLIDANDDRKIWEFEVLKAGRSTSDPLYVIKKDKEELSETQRSIITKYEQMLNEERKKYNLDENFESIRSTEETKTKIEILEESTINNMQFTKVMDDIYSRQNNDLKQLEPTELLIKFKFESYNLEIQKVVNSFRLKYRFMVLFPVTLYIISVLSIIISLFWRR